MRQITEGLVKGRVLDKPVHARRANRRKVQQCSTTPGAIEEESLQTLSFSARASGDLWQT